MIPTIIADLSDLHVNQTVAVCPPVVQLDDGGTYHASRTQRWLHDCLMDYKDRFLAYQGRHVVAWKGDLSELDCKRRSVQLITANKSTILNMTREVIEPIASESDINMFFRGTPAHTGKSAWIEETLAQDYDNAIRSSPHAASWWYFQGVIGDKRFDLAHHAPMPGDAQTYPRAALELARRAMWHYRVILKQEPPDIISRSHNHRKADSGDNYDTRAIFTPAWTVLPEYGFRSGKELNIAHVGGIIYICEPGKPVQVEKVIYEPKENKRVWAVKI